MTIQDYFNQFHFLELEEMEMEIEKLNNWDFDTWIEINIPSLKQEEYKLAIIDLIINCNAVYDSMVDGSS